MMIGKKLGDLARGISKPLGRGDSPNLTEPQSSADVPIRRQSEIMVSVVIPVYNSMPYLTELLNSLERQDLEPERFEVVAVDDGSTDYSGEILDVYAKRNTNLRVFHQENSGWPGKPRNVGIEKARGRYVFFVDADDRLGPEALRRMVEFAQEHAVDLLMPKMVGIDGRRVQTSLFSQTRTEATFEFMLRSLSPQKMIRRELLNGAPIRFREDRVRLEDGMAMVQAYASAKRMSILADYDYYEIRSRADGQNISAGTIEPDGYVSSLSEIARTARAFAHNDEDFARRLCAGLFTRKALRFYEGKRFFRYSVSEQQSWVDSHQKFLDEFVPINRSKYFSEDRMIVVGLISKGDLDGLRARARRQIDQAESPQVEQVAGDGTRTTFRVKAATGSAVPVQLRIVDRDTKEITRIDGTFIESTGSFHTSTESAVIAGKIRRLGDVSVHYSDGSSRRIAAPPEFNEFVGNGVRVYRTVNGFLSVDTRT
ncbi:glycosyltransferase family 2 protein [Glutamicibacter sp. NPDC087344]|uniref:glycosyltransferase family 2 protein n=1 Tax=Glutamicibacter sp. NPDC087344 TaxID=3363994 RepID=UPI00381A6C88